MAGAALWTCPSSFGVAGAALQTCLVACFSQIALARLRQVATGCRFRGRRGILLDVLKIDGTPEYALLKTPKKLLILATIIEIQVLLKYFNNLIEMYFNNIIGLFQKGFNCFLEQFSIPSKKIQPCFFLGLVISCQPHEAEPSA